jgi:Holliday junction resolvase
MREDLIHVAVRRFVRAQGWTLIAGQHPNGSDELPTLYIVDPTVARDNSPDPRRHSAEKQVPDLVAYKAGIMLLVELKPRFSAEDEAKLLDLLTNRRGDLLLALDAFLTVRRITLPTPTNQLTFVPCLGFADGSRYTPHRDFCYFLVRDMNTVTFVGNAVVPML